MKNVLISQYTRDRYVRHMWSHVLLETARQSHYFLALGVIASVQVLFDKSIANHLVTGNRCLLTANVFVPASLIISQNLQNFYILKINFSKILSFPWIFCYENLEPYGS